MFLKSSHISSSFFVTAAISACVAAVSEPAILGEKD